MGLWSVFKPKTAVEIISDKFIHLAGCIEDSSTDLPPEVWNAVVEIQTSVLQNFFSKPEYTLSSVLSKNLKYVEVIVDLLQHEKVSHQLRVACLQLLFAAVHPYPSTAQGMLGSNPNSFINSLTADQWTAELLPSIGKKSGIQSSSLCVGTHLVVKLRWLEDAGTFLNHDSDVLQSLSTILVASLFAHIPTALVALKSSRVETMLVLNAMAQNETTQVVALASLAACAMEPSNREVLEGSEAVHCALVLVNRTRSCDSTVLCGAIFLAQIANSSSGIDEIVNTFLPDGTSGIEVILLKLSRIVGYKHKHTPVSGGNTIGNSSWCDIHRQQQQQSDVTKFSWPTKYVWQSVIHLLHVLCMVFREDSQREHLLRVSQMQPSRNPSSNITTRNLKSDESSDRNKVTPSSQIQGGGIAVLQIVSSLICFDLESVAKSMECRLCWCICGFFLSLMCFEPRTLGILIEQEFDIFGIAQKLLFPPNTLQRLVKFLCLQPNVLPKYQAYIAKAVFNFARALSAREPLFQETAIVEEFVKKSHSSTNVIERAVAILGQEKPPMQYSPSTQALVMFELLGAASHLAVHVEYVLKWFHVTSLNFVDGLLRIAESTVASITNSCMPTQVVEMKIGILRRALSVLGNLLIHGEVSFGKYQNESASQKELVIRRLHNVFVVTSNLDTILSNFVIQSTFLAQNTFEISRESHLSRMLIEVQLPVSFSPSTQDESSQCQKPPVVLQEAPVSLKMVHAVLKDPMSEHMQIRALCVIHAYITCYGWTRLWPMDGEWTCDEQLLSTILTCLVKGPAADPRPLAGRTYRSAALEREALRCLIAFTQHQNAGTTSGLELHLKFDSKSRMGTNSCGLKTYAKSFPLSEKTKPAHQTPQRHSIPLECAVTAVHGSPVHISDAVAAQKRRNLNYVNPHGFPEPSVQRNFRWGAVFRDGDAVLVSSLRGGSVRPPDPLQPSQRAWSVAFWIRSMWPARPITSGLRPGSRRYLATRGDEADPDWSPPPRVGLCTVVEFAGGTQLAIRENPDGTQELGVLEVNYAHRRQAARSALREGAWRGLGTEVHKLSRGWHRVVVTASPAERKTACFVDGCVSGAADRFISGTEVVAVGNSLGFKTPLSSRWCLADLQFHSCALQHAGVVQSLSRSSFNRRPWEFSEELAMAHTWARKRLCDRAEGALMRPGHVRSVIRLLETGDGETQSLAIGLLFNLSVYDVTLPARHPELVTVLMKMSTHQLLVDMLLANLQ